MTLDEKISQMLHYAPAIDRLGVPAYNWWSEALHGVARAGVATVFPQAIGMASSFDTDLLKEIAEVISDEGRAKHHEFVRQDDRDIYKGLTFWSPNINIFRDPRWGRGHETYGEDPYLTGELGLAFIKGLQGDHPKYLKLAACAKHFAVHSGPENLRHSFDAVVSQKDLYETYLPAFEKAVKVGNVESVMGAYNRMNGEPCCGSKTLLQDILRDSWGFKGHVVSDCWAICDFHLHHKVTNTPQESAAMAVKNGSDLNCGKTYASLMSSIHQGLLEESDIDIACTRLFETRFKLGMFDPEEDVPYAQIPYEVNDQESHHKLAIEAAKRSMVLLRNKDYALPLNINEVKSIAVIGPNANDPIMMLGNYNGTPSRSVTPLQGIQDVAKDKARVYYAKGCEVVHSKTENLATTHDRIAEAVSAALKADVAIVCVGLNASYEGEEGDAGNSEAAGDKDTLELPGLQNELLEAIVGTGTKTIVVVLTGSAMDLTWAHEHAQGIVQAWYPGAEGGVALAELLFGNVDFSARLPVTYVRHTEDLPDFLDYSMKNRTYRYIETTPLYPFGYGLSYNEYAYSELTLSANKLQVGEDLKVSVTVKNMSEADGREVTQVYLKDMEASVVVPHCSLVAFDNVELKGKESRTLTFTISSEKMAVITNEGKSVIEPGRFTISVGGHGPDEQSALLTGTQVLETEFEVIELIND
jgi:beta-glucosidase